ncbi:MAG: PhnD/SsuA/transferrin family substrate-binding protein [Roseitalea sp.]|jgi:phosphonate transport system substrate-binding protein|nr:PhnD/SsuA/transferrin family substrate-binding protein [Roseitalea sp.]MBO6722907.1 PhnD/SsuA/transferrin family substrate-binding protein [Roseitalea sp.]MBO6745059.1 PhnD/SsuA/transferrin family substrate-binding protein [Roseitalea sp.]
MKNTLRLVLALALVALASPGRADWRSQTGVFRIGVVDEAAGSRSPEHFSPFRDAVSAAIGMPAEVLLLRDAPSLIDAQTAGRIEYAVLSALGYAAAQEMCGCLVPLAAPTSASGAFGVRSVLVVRKAGGDGRAALAGGPVGHGPAGSLTGDLAPAISFRLAGSPLHGAGLDLVLQPSFEVARDAFLAGDLAAFFAWDYAAPDGAAKPEGGLAATVAPADDAATEITWRSSVIPFGPHAVRDTVPDDVREALRSMLVALHDTSPAGFDAISPSLAGAFRPAQPGDYGYAVELVRSLSASR